MLLQSIEDWIQDFKQFLVDSPYSTALEDMYPDVHVHTGFLQQLQAVTDKAPNTTQNIGNVLMDMSGGVTPSLVIVTGVPCTSLHSCIGHSLCASERSCKQVVHHHHYHCGCTDDMLAE